MYKPILGFLIGAAVGWWVGLGYAATRDWDDLSNLFYMPGGAFAGALLGTTIGAAL